VAGDQNFTDSQIGKVKARVAENQEVRVRDLITTVDRRESVDH
jgi:hypothetical protein